MCCLNVQAASNWLAAASRVQDKHNGTALSSYEKKVQYEIYAKDCMLAATESAVDVFEKPVQVPHIGGLDVTATFLRRVTPSTKAKRQLASARVTIYTGTLEYLRLAGYKRT